MQYYGFDHVIDSDHIFQPSHLTYIFSDYKVVAVHPMENDFLSNINSDDVDVVILFNDYNSSDDFIINFQKCQSFTSTNNDMF